MKTDPSSLIVLIRQGDERAFEKVYHAYRETIFTYAMRFTRSVEASEEVTHDIFLKLWQFRENIDTSYNFRNLLFTISKNQLLNYRRHEKHVASLSYDVPVAPAVSVNAGEEDILAEEFMQAYRKAVDQLPPQCRRIFVMSRLEHKSYDEIAQNLCLSRDTVRLQIIKSRKILRKKLGAAIR